MNTTQVSTCLPVHTQLLDPQGLRHVPLPMHRDGAVLQQDFANAPQFASIDAPYLCKYQRNALCAILVGEDDYYLQQAAMYLATLARKSRTPSKKAKVAKDKAKAWKKLGTPLDEEKDELDSLSSGASVDLTQSLVMVAPSFIDPSLTETLPGQPKGQVNLSALPCAALYVGAPSGPVLNEYIIEQIFAIPKEDKTNPPDVFFAIHPNQMDRDLCQTLQLNYGFHICQVGRPTTPYLEQLFRDYAESLFITLDDQIDVPAIVAHTQRLRGNAFRETDLESALFWVVQKQCDNPTTQDFCFRFTDLSGHKSGLAQLESMVGLTQVKSAVHRLLAMEKLALHRRNANLSHAPRHRHMAFSGPPGTGKTVCAQLVAQILREEGSGSGRFVEAGREDLVGQYVGHTAPKVASLFEKAQGGVLFLDEIGALVTCGTTSDAYTDEAVNALVYHMDRNPETLVIFATYPEEMTTFLDSNPGLSSRIAQSVTFTPYDSETLTTMFANLAKDRGYALPDHTLPLIQDYFATTMARHPRTFGNGREVRRLLNAAEEEMALRLMEDAQPNLAFTPTDLSTVITRFTPVAPAKRLIGFAV